MRYLAFLLPLLFSCASFGRLDPKAQRSVDTFECYVEVLAPYVDEVCNTAELVRDVVEGKADLGRTLTLLGHAGDVQKVVEALGECLPKPPMPANLEPM